ncbi:MAG: four-carbon acid sugar kinase family protein [Hungatella hathewayi]|nr:four-carbon acid sugar kinase family protein [Hungatella hathewayi]
MIKLLVIADDFTGALDTGVQFSEKGIEIRVIVDDGKANSRLNISETGTIQVLVIDAETRHMKPDDAYQKVFSIVREAGEANIPYIYKKTDSALRGNIGSELSALLEASGEKVLPFLPAFPQMRRITKNGIHYIDRLPVSESVFGRDPFEPVLRDSVKEIICLQSSVHVSEIKNESQIPWEETGIWVFDSMENEDLEHAAKLLKEKKVSRIMAGCAGFASMLPEMLELEGIKTEHEMLEQNLLVVCGSVNPITRRQLEYGECCGYHRICLSAVEKLEPGYWTTQKGINTIRQFKKICDTNSCCILDSNDAGKQKETLDYAYQHHLSTEQMRCRISRTMGVIVKKMMDEGVKAVLLITGGDTLLGFMEEIEHWELKPISEISPGCVLTKIAYRNSEYHIITKSGGFGDERLLENIIKKIKKVS